MKELVLSLLSRGYSQVVQSDGKRQYGRLEVCFEPEVITTLCVTVYKVYLIISNWNILALSV